MASQDNNPPLKFLPLLGIPKKVRIIKYESTHWWHYQPSFANDIDQLGKLQKESGV
jgi:hypothetical protein